MLFPWPNTKNDPDWNSLSLPRQGGEPGIFGFSVIFSLDSSALDHSATALSNSLIGILRNAAMTARATDVAASCETTAIDFL